jgi:hypothetical protein
VRATGHPIAAISGYLMQLLSRSPRLQFVGNLLNGYRYLVVLKWISAFDRHESRGLTPPVGEEKLECSNPVGLTDRLPFRPRPSAIASNPSASLLGLPPHTSRTVLATPLGLPPGLPDCPGWNGRPIDRTVPLLFSAGSDMGEG